MKNKLLFLCLNILMFSSLRADFFAFRKLTHAQTGKIVYFLYDIHASVEVNPPKKKDIDAKEGEIIKKERDDFKQVLRGVELERIEDPLHPLERYATDFKIKHLPNLNKQQQDLLFIIKHYEVSLINEDWQDYFADETEQTIGKATDNRLRSCIGERKIVDGNYFRLPVTPMKGLGKNLIGKYTQKELHQVPEIEGVYFYNADSRQMSSLDTEEDVAGVDNKILIGLNKILKEKSSDSVIIAAGYIHCVALVKELENQGYVSGPLVFSNDLEAIRLSKDGLDDSLIALENNDSTGFDVFNYDVISRPLNLNETLAEEIKNDANGSVKKESLFDKVGGFVDSFF
ncbi:MAG: hypothetical protein ACJAZS_000865 [Alteromonas naphthalenivorans]|jgi:hypothetical protein